MNGENHSLASVICHFTPSIDYCSNTINKIRYNNNKTIIRALKILKINLKHYK
jgi:hypothetical protein